MTAVFAAVGLTQPLDAASVRRALGAAGVRGGTLVDAQIHEDFALAVATPFAGAARCGQGSAGVADDRFVVAADATLYHVEQLRQSIPPSRRTSLTGETAIHLLREAFRAYGTSCTTRLEGDFAFVVWDRLTRRLFCARDFTGRRPLYYSQYRGGVVVASAIACFATLPGFNAEVDVATVGADAAGLFFSIDDETCLRGARTLGAGCTATWTAGRSIHIERVWHPSVAETSILPFDEAAVRLCELLQSATLERIGSTGPTTVWMSGGRDSTAVFASGMNGLRATGNPSSLSIVSRSHPAGDPEREDDAVNEVARFWGVQPSWVNVKQVPMFRRAEMPGRWSTEPFEQPFKELTRALAYKTRAAGATIALDGHGGDFLFQVSRAYLADLVSTGQVALALKDWRSMDEGRDGVHGFLRAGIQPALPRWALRAAAFAFHRNLRGAMERVAPPWIDRRFLAAHDIDARCRTRGPDAQRGRNAVERETRFCLTHPFFARVNAAMAGYALEYGVELRSPILDRRVVEFALTRPRDERNRGGDQKRLLRAAMAGLLPPSVLAPRRGKRGTLAPYFAYHMHTDGLASLRSTLPAFALADLGIVDSRALSVAVARFATEGPTYPHVEALFCTLQAERWLRAQIGTATSPANRAPHVPRASSEQQAHSARRGETAPHLRRAGSPTTLSGD